MFMILWIIAGAFIGWIGMDLIPLAMKNKIITPLTYKVMAAFIGALTTYTILMQFT